MYTRTFKRIAKKSGVDTKTLEKYWKRATASYNRQMEKAAKGERPKIEGKNSYIMAAALRMVQKTGSRPHKKIGSGKKGKAKKAKVETSESFVLRVNQILEGIEGVEKAESDGKINSFSFEMKYGTNLGLVLQSGHEVRIGLYKPGQYDVVVTNPNGEFPILPLLTGGNRALFGDRNEAIKFAKESFEMINNNPGLQLKIINNLHNS